MVIRDALAATLDRPGLPPGLRALALLHGAAVVGRFEAVTLLAALARERGQDEARLLEAALQVVPYGGFPRAIATLEILAEGALPGPRADGRESRPRAELLRDGLACFGRVYGSSAGAVAGRLDELLPGFGNLVLEDAYGRILSRSGLPLGERELLAVAALALARLPAPLEGHVRGALRNGFPVAAVDDILQTCVVLADPDNEPTIQQARDRLSRKVYRP